MRAATLTRWLRDTIAVSRGGTDAYGQPAGVSTVTAPAAVMRKARRWVDDHGTEFMSTTQIMTTYPILPGDRVSVDGVPVAIRSVREVHGPGPGAVPVYEVLL